MTGGWWILSYVLLSFTVLCLILAVLSLYRLVARRPRDFAPALAWPFDRFRPGDLLPKPSSMDEGAPWTGFYIFGSSEHDCFSSAIAATSVAARWKLETCLVMPSTGELAWIATLPPAWVVPTVRIPAAEFESYGIVHGAVIAFVRDGYLIDALSGPSTPSEVAQHLKIAAAPLNLVTAAA